MRSDGALTKVMDAEPNERGEVLKHLLSNPRTRVRATEALKRYGFDTSDIMRLAVKWRDPTALNKAIEDAARFEQVGQDAFSGQEAAATRSAVGKKALKYGAATAAGSAGVYEIWRLLAGKSPTLHQ